MKKSIEMLCACLIVLVLLVACSPCWAVSSVAYTPEVAPTEGNRSSSGGGLKAIVPPNHEKTLDAYATSEARGPTETVEPTVEPTPMPTEVPMWDTSLAKDLLLLQNEEAGGLVPEVVSCDDVYLQEIFVPAHTIAEYHAMLPIVHSGSDLCFSGKFVNGVVPTSETLYWLLLVTPINTSRENTMIVEGGKKGNLITDSPGVALYVGKLPSSCALPLDTAEKIGACRNALMKRVPKGNFNLMLWDVIPLTEEAGEFLVAHPPSSICKYPGISSVYID